MLFLKTSKLQGNLIKIVLFCEDFWIKFCSKKARIMALLDNMYAPYSHLMQRAFTNNTQIPEDPSITRLNSSAGSNESSPPNTVHHNRLNAVNTSDCHPASKFGHYGGTVMTMNLKLEQANFRHFVSHPESPVAAQENNINEDNRKDVHNSKVMKDLYLEYNISTAVYNRPVLEVMQP